ncbi:transcriptional regulator [Streptomyces spiroverticillatus]|uniref:Transcriptional regulator n=1 Tax=Streptomyces finlayi TaxID=67296 RepID=A0A918X7F7_9ACTN|nr:LCP family protein [Streptomyces finlayi]GHA41165.1 transcriptional regulator [Streptomyces spiroverticillatus]GHD16832.1 transcriptional regulator [Streptomyces finlayi]
MGNSSVHGEGTRARNLGWDDSLYEGADSAARSSEAAGGGHGGRRRGGSRRRRPEGGPGRGKRILRWGAIALAVLILGTAGAGYLYYQHLNSNLRSSARSSGNGPDKPKANAAGQTPLNILLIGSDDRSNPENVKLGGGKDLTKNPPLADVQKLLHVSADRKHASVVSIPRDTRVDIPECKDPKTQKVSPPTNGIINKTLALGGPSCVLDTWQKLTNIYIDHWLMIDFAGVVEMSDAVGGVEVCLNQGVWDRPTAMEKGGSGLKLSKGPHKIQGEQALQWLRTRHAFGSDKGRAKAQHMYMNSMMRQLQGEDAFTNAGRITSLAETATKALQVSDEIGSPKKLFDLAMELKDVPSDSITMTSLPTIADPKNPNAHYVVSEKDADKVLRLLQDDIPFDKNGAAKSDGKNGKKPAEKPAKKPSAAPGELAVSVQNGTGNDTQGPTPGRAKAVAQTLADKGYSRSEASRDPVRSERTTVKFPSAELEGDAQAVAKALGLPASAVSKSTDVSGVTLVVGADWRTGSSYPKAEVPKAGDVPESAEAVKGDDKGCMDVYGPYKWNGKD